MTKTDERPTPETVDILRQKLRVAERVKQAAIDCTKSWDNILDELVWERPDIDAHEIPADYLSAMIARYPHHAEALADFAKRWNSDKPIPDEELADMEIDEESVKRSTASCLMMLKWSTRIRDAERDLREAQARVAELERECRRMHLLMDEGESQAYARWQQYEFTIATLTRRLEEAEADISNLRAADSCAYQLTAKLACMAPALEQHEKEFLSRDAVMDAVFRWRMDHDAALAQPTKGEKDD